MKTWFVTAKIDGVATAEVQAETREDAIGQALGSGAWKVDEWNISPSDNRGGWIDAVEDNR